MRVEVTWANCNTKTLDPISDAMFSNYDKSFRFQEASVRGLGPCECEVRIFFPSIVVAFSPLTLKTIIAVASQEHGRSWLCTQTYIVYILYGCSIRALLGSEKRSCRSDLRHLRRGRENSVWKCCWCCIVGSRIGQCKTQSILRCIRSVLWCKCRILSSCKVL